MQVIERTFSEFLRHPKEVVAELDNSDVVLRRRSAPALHLRHADRENARSEAVSGITRVLRHLSLHYPAAVGKSLSEAYPWTKYLPDDEREQFLEEFAQELAAAASIGDFKAVAQFLHEWKATAEVHADPELARRLAGPHEITHGGRVPRPSA